MHHFFSVLVWAVGGYGLILLVVFFMQSSLLFFPSNQKFVTPAQIGLAYEELKLITEDNLRLDAWLVPAENARGVLVFFHGNAGNISHRLDHLQIFHELGLTTLIFDYRGYGESEGKMGEFGSYFDSKAAWNYLIKERGISPDKVILYGQSLGGAIASWLAADESPGALILDSAFTSIPDLAAEVYPFLPARWLSRFEYNTRDNLKRVSCPVLIIHADDDEIVPVEHGHQLFKAANEPKTFVTVKGHHNDGFLVSIEKYTREIDEFIRQFVE